MAETFKKGEIVQLKSGGPKMTVKSASEGGSIRCQWFAANKLVAGFFEAESLVRFDETEKGKQEKDNAK